MRLILPRFGGKKSPKTGKYYTVLYYKDLTTGKKRVKKTNSPLDTYAKLVGYPSSFIFNYHIIQDGTWLPDGYKIVNAKRLKDGDGDFSPYIELELKKSFHYLEPDSAATRMFGVTKKPVQIYQWAIVDKDPGSDSGEWYVVQIDAFDDKMMELPVK